MRVLLHSYVFRPMLGGIETATHNLAVGLVEAGHEVTVVTDTLGTGEDYRASPYAIVRTRKMSDRARLVKTHDVVHATGTFPACFPLARLHGKPFSWTHQNYRLLSLDGLGWDHGEPSPLEPYQSFRHHRRQMGIRHAALQLSLLYARRMVAHLADANVAISIHMSRRQPLPRQRIIYNPVDCSFFGSASRDDALAQLRAANAKFSFMGRLVSEKGVKDLILAFSEVISTNLAPDATLKIIGDGPERGKLEALCQELAVAERVRFTGSMSGADLKEEVRSAGIFVLPSAWEEPMGIVAVELMAAGKPLIVSEVGGLAECCADSCLTFRNRDHNELAKVMLRLAGSFQLQEKLLRGGLERVKEFDKLLIARKYGELFAELAGF